MELIKPNTKIDFMGKIPYAGGISIGLMVLSVVGMFARGFNWGIDFAGGTELQVRFAKDVPTTEIRTVLAQLGFDKNEVQPYGPPEQHEYLVRIERITSLAPERIEELKQAALAHFGKDRLLHFAARAREGDRLFLELALPGAAATPTTPHEALDGGSADAVAAAVPDADAGVASEDGGAVEETATASVEPAVASLMQELSQFFAQQGVELRKSEPLQISHATESRVDVTVHVKGVADRLERAFAAAFGEVENRRTDYVDSAVSKALRQDGLYAILLALGAILIYIAIRFDFYFSPGAVIALIHDVLITVGVFTWFQLEFNLTTIAALLTIVGYSLNDTIVVYDRIRETVPTEDKLKGTLSDYLNRAINDTLSRTLLTSGTTMLVVVTLLIFTSGVIFNFGIALCIGILVGTYSSIFVASPFYLGLRKYFPAKA